MLLPDGRGCHTWQAFDIPDFHGSLSTLGSSCHSCPWTTKPPLVSAGPAAEELGLIGLPVQPPVGLQQQAL